MVDVLRLQVVLQVGRLGWLVRAEADSALDRSHPFHLDSADHTFQHRLILLLACKGLR